MADLAYSALEDLDQIGLKDGMFKAAFLYKDEDLSIDLINRWIAGRKCYRIPPGLWFTSASVEIALNVTPWIIPQWNVTARADSRF